MDCHNLGHPNEGKGAEIYQTTEETDSQKSQIDQKKETITCGKGKFLVGCAMCGKNFTEAKKLAEHIESAHKGTLDNHIDNEHKENIQSMSPKSDSDLSTSENVSLERVQLYQCSICNHNLSSLHKLEVHTMIFHEFKCPECYEQLSSKVELFHHLKTVHTEKKHRCRYCNSKFLLKYTLENHIDNKHKENYQSMSPKNDSDSTNHARIDNLREHSNEHLTKIDYKCKLCKFKTLETSSLKSHMVTGHKVDETQTDWNKYISLCKRVVTIPKNKTNIDKSNDTPNTKQEVSSKIMVEETKLTSQKSDQASMNKLSLIQEYNKKEMYMCRICDDQFDSVGELTKHVSSVHEEKKHISNSTDKLFMCTICRDEFVETEELAEHITTVHEEKKPQNLLKNKLYLCAICEDQFAEMEELTEHITAVHEEKKPQNDSSKKLYLCTICRDQFAEIEELVKHYSSLHEKKKPPNDSTKKLYLCTICRDQFADIEELVKHYSSLHEEKKQLQSNYDTKINPRNRKHKTKKVKKVKKLKCYPFAIENLDLRFPHLSEAIFDQLDNKTFSKCRTVSKNWCYIIEGQKSRWSRVLRNHIRNFKKSPESWKKIVNKFPFDMAKDLALTTKEFNINHYEPLHYAAIKGDLNMYKFIHYKLEDKNPKNDDGWMPIHFASRHGRSRIVEFIIGNLEDKNPKDNLGLTPLCILAANGHLDVFKCIAKYEENINLACADGVTPLHIAAANRNVDICNYILKIVTNKNPKDKSGITPLHSAAEHGLLDLYKAIAQSLEDKNPANEDRVTPLYLAAQRGQVEVCEYILENVSTKNPQVKDGATPLHAAATNGHFGAYKCIAQHVNDKNPRQNNRKTPFDMAVKRGHLDICEYIVDNTNIKKQKNRLQKLVERASKNMNT